MHTGSTMLSAGMSRFPIALAASVTCAWSTRNWFAGLAMVRAMSPCVMVTWFMMR